MPFVAGKDIGIVSHECRPGQVIAFGKFNARIASERTQHRLRLVLGHSEHVNVDVTQDLPRPRTVSSKPGGEVRLSQMGLGLTRSRPGMNCAPSAEAARPSSMGTSSHTDRKYGKSANGRG